MLHNATKLQQNATPVKKTERRQPWRAPFTLEPTTNEPTNEPIYQTTNQPMKPPTSIQIESMCAKERCACRKEQQFKNLRRCPQSRALLPGYKRLLSQAKNGIGNRAGLFEERRSWRRTWPLWQRAWMIMKRRFYAVRRKAVPSTPFSVTCLTRRSQA